MLFYAFREIHLQGDYVTTVLLALQSSQPVPLYLHTNTIIVITFISKTRFDSWWFIARFALSGQMSLQLQPLRSTPSFQTYLTVLTLF